MTPADTAPAHSCARPPSRRKRRGFNLVEAAIVLGVVGLVIGGIWVTASAVRENAAINDLLGTISSVTQNVETNMNDMRTTYMDVDVFARYLKNSDLIPKDASDSDGSWSHSLTSNGYVVFLWDTSSSQNAPLTIQMYNINRGACMKLIRQLRPYMRTVRYPNRISSPVRTPDEIIAYVDTLCAVKILNFQFLTIFPR